MKFYIKCIVLIMLLMQSSCFLFGSNDPPVSDFHTISGTVTDADTGTSLSGVTISTLPPTEQTMTNNGGQFVLDLNATASQRYTVNASQAGYLPNFAELTVQEGGDTTIRIALSRIP